MIKSLERVSVELDSFKDEKKKLIDKVLTQNVPSMNF